MDYLHPRKFPILGPFMTWTLRAATVGVLAGVYQFNTQDVGTWYLLCKPACTHRIRYFRSHGAYLACLDGLIVPLHLTCSYVYLIPVT